MDFLGLGSRGSEPLLHVRPVDDLEDTLDVVGPDVLVLEVVRVLPHVDAQQGHETGRGFEGVLQKQSNWIERVKHIGMDCRMGGWVFEDIIARVRSAFVFLFSRAPFGAKFFNNLEFVN